jgi:hypothetical protein
MFFSAMGFRNNEEMLKAIAEKPEVAKAYKEYSPINHLTPDDPPILLVYADAAEGNGGVHGGWFGVKFQEKADALGIKSVFLQVTKDKEHFPGYPGGILKFVATVVNPPAAAKY